MTIEKRSQGTNSEGSTPGVVSGERVPETISEQLARLVEETRLSDLTVAVVTMAKLSVLDWLGSALAGSTREPAVMARQVIDEFGGAPQATVFPEGRKSSAANAAFANGVASHIIELDDVHKTSTFHPAAPIIPAALAAAEKEGASGKDFLAAVVVGYDVAIRVGEAINPSHYRFWHPTGTCGTFGAAAAVGKILGLPADQLVNALGSAGTQAAGLWEFLADGAMSKHLHPGKAAMNGLLAAYLARRGFTGAGRILDGDRGFCRATSTGYDLDKITRDLGRHYKILENCFKIHACCGHTHSAIDLAIELGRSVRPEEIERITVHTYHVVRDLVGNFSPRTPYEAKFSLPYGVAAGFVFGRAGLEEFAPEHLRDPRIQGTMAKIQLVIDSELDALYPERWPAAVEVRTSSGQGLSARADYPRGNPENPVSEGDLIAKFRSLAGSVVDDSVVEDLIAVVLGIEGEKNMSRVFARVGLKRARA